MQLAHGTLVFIIFVTNEHTFNDVESYKNTIKRQK